MSQSIVNQRELTLCPGCSSFLQVEVFPALFRRPVNAGTGEITLLEAEAACFFHANKKAVVPCHGCGRFLCALCDCELNGDHFCPACLETGKTKGKIKNLERRRTLYDTIALHLAVLPVLLLVFWVFSLITAPMALFMAIRFWNAPGSIIPRTKIRYVLAIVFSTLEIVGWAIGILFVIGRIRA